MRDARHAGTAAATVCALAAGFAWFDIPGHLSAFSAQGGLLAGWPLGGHAVFLLGMLGVVLLGAVAPLWLERHFVPALMSCMVMGPSSLVVYCTSTTPLGLAASIALMGFFNVLFLNLVAARILSRAFDRTWQVVIFSCAIAGKTLVAWLADRYLDLGGQTILLVTLPVAGVACALAALCLMLLSGRDLDGEHATFTKPSSTIMLGMLLVSSIIFAATRGVSAIGSWGSSYALVQWGPGGCLAVTAVYLAVCYVTLARTDSRLLFRFLPALLLLFVFYAFLYAGNGTAYGIPQETWDVLAQYGEMYGQTLAWTVILLAIRTLDMPPMRVMGLFFGTFTVFELVMQGFLGTYSEGALLLVLLSFFVAFAALIAALSHFYAKGDADGTGAENASEPAPTQAEGAAPAPRGDDARRSIAARYGLSERETQVFLLLVQGRTRRFICDELFIADGTASTHIRRIYEKLGVHSKQELLTLVLGSGPESGR